jgi:hypothetical protein
MIRVETETHDHRVCEGVRYLVADAADLANHLFLGPLHRTITDELVDKAAAELSTGLMGGVLANVALVCRLAHAEEQDATWWGSPVGRAVAQQIGYTSPEVPRSIVLAILGVSRQRVHELVQLGRLRNAFPGMGITQESLLTELRERR